MISDNEVQKLKDKIKELEEEVKRLKNVEKKLEETKKEFEHTKKEFEEYKSKHAQTVSNLQKALKIKPDLRKKSKPLGAPKGHRSYTRHIPERYDNVRELKLNKCPQCNTPLPAEPVEIRSRYGIDIKLVSKAKVTKYLIPRKYCSTCKGIVEPEVPGMLPHARYGLNLMLLIMYLRLGLRLPCNKVCEYLMTMFNLDISEAEVIVVLRQLAVAFGDYYAYLERIVKFARVKYSDTTGWRVNGLNYFVWVFIGCGATLYQIRKRNNHKVGLAFLGKQKGNTLVVDRFSAYRTLAKKAGFVLQLCWSHILEDSKALKKNFGAEGRYVHNKLKEIFDLANGLNHKGNAEMVEQLKGMIFELTLRHYEHSTVRKFVNALYYRDVDDLFRFVTDPDIDATNNISERKLRNLVIIRKISNGSRSTRGAHATAMLLSVIETLKTNGVNPLKGLHNILKNPSGY